MSLVRIVRLTAMILGLGIVTAPHTVDRLPQPKLPAADHARIQDNFGKLPLSFIENRGQADERVAYTLSSSGHSMYFTPDGLTLRLTQGKGENAKAHTIKVELVDATTERIESRGRAPGVVSYFKGPRDSWKTAIPTHKGIGYVQPWPGIDLTYRGHGGKLESVYTVAPHADPARIKLRYSGQTSLKLDGDGNLVLTSSVGEVRETAPILYQEIDAKRIPVQGRYALLDDNTVAFHVAKYDPDHALVIDPTLAYAGYIGGGQGDWGRDIAVDSAGNAYVTGYTQSTEAIGFPVTVGPDITYNGGEDAFVVKVNAAGTALVYAGYIGGDNADLGEGIVVDSTGNAYVTGYTQSTETTFPVLGGPDLTFNGAFRDAFVAKVNPAGTALIYAGYVGGDNEDEGWGIAVDSAGSAYVTGTTTSTQATFPVTVGPDLTYDGSQDAFVAKVLADGSALVYAGYIGGSGIEQGYGIAVDSAGNAYVTGSTTSTEAQGFPVTVGPDPTYNGGTNDAFVAKVNAAGNALDYAGYIGGDTDLDVGYGIAVDGNGNAYVTGYTYSTEVTFPVLGGPDLIFNGDEDAFVAKVNAAGTALTYCGYIGGSGRERGYGIAVDGDGNAYVTGYTYSTEATFPALVGPDLTYNGGNNDAFVAKVNAAGSALDYAGYLGGGGDELGLGIALDSAGNAYVTGYTSSTETSFPVSVGPDLTHNGVTGANDAFVAKIAEAVNTAPVATDDTASTPEDTALVIAMATLLANDTDAEFDPLTLTMVTPATNGSVAIMGTDVVYTPLAAFTGMDAFDYTIEDPSNATAMATVNITVTAVDDPDGGDGGPVSDLGATPKDGGDGEDGGSDLGADLGADHREEEGCGCALGGSPRPDVSGPLLLLALLALRGRFRIVTRVRVA